MTVGFTLIYLLPDRLRILAAPDIPDILLADVTDKIFKKAQLHKSIRVYADRPAANDTTRFIDQFLRIIKIGFVGTQVLYPVTYL